MPNRTRLDTSAHRATKFCNAAFQKRSELLFNESRHRALPFLLPGEECFQLFGDNAVQQAFFGMSRSISSSDRHAPAGAQTRGQRKRQRRKGVPGPARLKCEFFAINPLGYSAFFATSKSLPVRLLAPRVRGLGNFLSVPRFSPTRGSGMRRLCRRNPEAQE